MRFCVSFSIALIVLGCARSDPKSTPLTPGQRVVVQGVRPDRKATFRHAGDLAVFVEPGVTVTVRHDGLDERDDELRMVQVTVETGNSQGKSGTMYRMDLRPAATAD